MSEDVKEKYEARISNMQSEFDALKKEEDTLKEEVSKLNQRISVIRSRQIQIQGGYTEVKQLMKELDEEKSSEEKSSDEGNPSKTLKKSAKGKNKE